MVWVDRQGREQAINAPPRPYGIPRLSPDGTRLAVEVRDTEGDIWIWDFGHETFRRLTFDPASDQSPVWTPDGQRILFSSSRTGAPNIYWHAADGTGTDVRLTTSQNTQGPQAITSDGMHILGFEVRPATIPDVVQWPIGGGEPATLVQTPTAEFAVDISPNGRFIAYQANESGIFEVYVRPYPNPNDGRWQISSRGGTRPIWARNGRELFFVDLENTLMSTPVQTDGGTFVYGNAGKVFDRKYSMPTAFRSYDVSPDGKRFLMIKEGASDETMATQATMVVVERWFEELKRRVPAR
jgi:serine/threonine-protein kinase